MNKATLLNALNDYLAYIQLDSLGDINPKINAIVTCRDSASCQDSITENFVKSNFPPTSATHFTPPAKPNELRFSTE